MPNEQYPCAICSNLVIDEDSICCDACDLWVHLKCTNLSYDQFKILGDSDRPFYCYNCESNEQANSNLNNHPVPPNPTSSHLPPSTTPSQNQPSIFLSSVVNQINQSASTISDQSFSYNSMENPCQKYTNENF